MNKTTASHKTAGKIFAAFTILILLAVLALSWYIGGQKRAAEKYFASIASGNYKDMSKVITPAYLDGFDTDSFREECRSGFEKMPVFSDLDTGNIISSRVKITESRMNGDPGSWICTADVDFYSDGKVISFDDLGLYLDFSGGKWLIDLDFKEIIGSDTV